VKAVNYRVVAKNLVLIAAGLAVVGGGTVRHIREEQEQQQKQTSRNKRIISFPLHDSIIIIIGIRKRVVRLRAKFKNVRPDVVLG
jgi:heme/copper-type cytochrome/quinol oxidase subunit 2